MSHPEKSFEELEKEYYSAFGAAAGEVEEFFKYYRHEIFLKRLYPKRAELCRRGQFNNFARGVFWDLDRYYSLKDFDRTDAILARAAQRKLTSEESRRIHRLQLGNRHSRLVYIAVTSKGDDKIKASTALLNFRLANRKRVKLDFINLFNSERSTGGVDVDAALTLKNFSEYRKTPLLWIALTDEKDAGLREKWQQLNFTDIRQKGFPLPTDSPWERIAKRHTAVPTEVREKMKTYDGVVWYFQQLAVPRSWKGKQIYLCFGAVDESCELFVNGKASGAHPFVKPDDWTTPFALRIDRNINWEIPGQAVAVRVKDTAGSGGIWKRVWLAVK